MDESTEENSNALKLLPEKVFINVAMKQVSWFLASKRCIRNANQYVTGRKI
jgi:hypothetical protein